jgi:GNAT superfamily N-acetyltransferase
MTIRPAVIDDIPMILKLIKGLAEYEKALDEVVATEEDLERTLFHANPTVYCHVATSREKVVGMAIWHLNYSTWLGKHGMYLEDLFVEPEERGNGHGLSLLRYLASICLERGYQRFQWWVLDWNKPAIEFYKSFGAIPMDEWTVFRSSGESLSKLSQV